MPNPFVSVINLGCRVNRVESDRMTTDFAQAGFALVDPDEADLVVINTCAVTGEAEAKTRKAVRHALGLARSPYVIATGCVVNLHPEMLRELSDRVITEPSKISVVSRACEVLGYDLDNASDADASAHDLAELLGRKRLGVKIQDGCNNRCSYCIVWKARGPERSVPVSAVLDQVRKACEASIPEIVLTGVNLGAYDGESPHDTHVEIDELLSTILRETEIPHIRISSVEPMDVSERLIDVMAAHPDRVAPFLHLPVQSGCSETLRRMNRPYSSEDFEQTVSMIRSKIPAISLSCDVIVGFPGETDAEFERSLELCRRVGFSRMHVFRYSARPGTPAATAPDQVAPEVMADRSKRMRSLAQELSLHDARSRVGSSEIAVIEHGDFATLGSFHKAVVDDPAEVPASGVFHADILSCDASGLLHIRPSSDSATTGSPS